MDEAGETQAPPPRRSRMREAVREWMPRAVFEAVLITFGLLAALAVNGWNEDRQRAERIAEARRFFAEEIRANNDRLASPRYLPHHEALYRSLDAFSRIETPTGADRAAAFAPFENGVRPAFFRDSVWRSVSMGDLLPHMEPREVFLLTDIYRQQEDLSAVNRIAYAQILEGNPGSDDPEDVERLARQVRLYLGDVVAAERELLGLYEAALERLPEPKAPPARR